MNRTNFESCIVHQKNPVTAKVTGFLFCIFQRFPFGFPLQVKQPDDPAA